jgi:hypothetical protein
MAEVARILANPEELKKNQLALAVQRAIDMRKNMMETCIKMMKAMSAAHDTLIQNLRE